MVMDIVTIDFETYYDKDYSLSKMTTEQYVRSPLFEVIGVGVKVNGARQDISARKGSASIDLRITKVLVIAAIA
jgi:hypothetical protein